MTCVNREMPALRACAITLALALLAPGAQAQQQKDAPTVAVSAVEVFANSAMPITPKGGKGLPYRVDIYRMDALQQIERQLSQGLPQTEAEAMAWLRANEARIRRSVQAQAVQAANGVALAHYYRIDRLPAIVIDRKAVVYGVTDVEAAVRRYLQTQQGQKP